MDWTLNFFGAQVGYLNVFIVAVALGLMIALQLFVGRTRLGRAMRSTAQDREAAALMGVDINRTIAITFFIGSALAGAAGVVQGLYYGATNFQIGFYAGLKAFTAAVLGGHRQHDRAPRWAASSSASSRSAPPPSATAGGAPPLVFGVLVAVLVFRPAGLLGQQIGERA